MAQGAQPPLQGGGIQPGLNAAVVLEQIVELGLQLQQLLGQGSPPLQQRPGLLLLLLQLLAQRAAGVPGGRVGTGVDGCWWPAGGRLGAGKRQRGWPRRCSSAHHRQARPRGW